MKKDPRIYIQDMLDAIDKIGDYIAGINEVTFSQTSIVQDGVLRQLAIIGEAAGHVPSDIQKKQPRIPWRKIKDFRNVIIHEYDGISFSTVWNIATKELESLAVQLRELQRVL